MSEEREDKKETNVARALRTTHCPRVLAYPSTVANSEKEGWYIALKRSEFAFFGGAK